jgi:hypothetical protein
MENWFSLVLFGCSLLSTLCFFVLFGVLCFFSQCFLVLLSKDWELASHSPKIEIS